MLLISSTLGDKGFEEEMSPLLYLILLVLIIFSSLSVCILCVVKLVQVSNGFSLLDPDVSPGLRIRKWFLYVIAAATGLRCLSSVIEFIIFTIKVVKEDEPTESISYYENNKFHYALPDVVFICRVLPTILFLAYYALLGLYISNLSHSIRGQDFTLVRNGWVAGNAMVVFAVFQYLFIFPNPSVLNVVCLIVVLFYSLWMAWSAYWVLDLYRSSSNNSNSGGGGSASGGAVGAKRVLARMVYLVAVAAAALLLYAVVYVIDLSAAFDER